MNKKFVETAWKVFLTAQVPGIALAVIGALAQSSAVVIVGAAIVGVCTVGWMSCASALILAEKD